MSRRYNALGLIAGLYQVAGALVFFGGILIGGIQLLPSRSVYAGAFAATGITTIIVGVISGVGLYAFGELINLFRDMELHARLTAENSATTVENTARMVRLLEQLSARRRQQPPANPNPPSAPRSPQGNPNEEPRWG